MRNDKISKKIRRKIIIIIKNIIILFLILIIIFIPSYKIIKKRSHITNISVNGKLDFSNVIYKTLPTKKNDIKYKLKQIDKIFKNKMYIKNSDISFSDFYNDYTSIYLIYNLKDNIDTIELEWNIYKDSNNIKLLFKSLKDVNYLDRESIFYNNNYMYYYKNPNPKNMQIEYKNNTICVVYENQRYSRGIFKGKNEDSIYNLSPFYSGTIYICKENMDIKIHLEKQENINASDFQWIINSICNV